MSCNVLLSKATLAGGLRRHTLAFTHLLLLERLYLFVLLRDGLVQFLNLALHLTQNLDNIAFLVYLDHCGGCLRSSVTTFGRDD